jgi:hypothetical protein
MNREEQRVILRKLLADPIMWMGTCLKIRTKEGSLVPFVPNSFQKRLITLVMDLLRTHGRAFIVVLKGRQLGVSTVCRGANALAGAASGWPAMRYFSP